jgi:hypothetical protein
MKIYFNPFVQFFMFCLAFSLLSSCDSRYQGNKDTQIDSTELKKGTYDVDNPGNQGGDLTFINEPVSTNNAVKIHVPMDDQSWAEFREKYHVATRDGQIAEISNDLAMGPWLKWTDQISYQHNYRYAHNELWIQTFYREENFEQASTPRGNRQLLTIDLSDSLGLSNLWHQMDEAARHIEDSLMDRSRRPR